MAKSRKHHYGKRKSSKHSRKHTRRVKSKRTRKQVGGVKKKMSNEELEKMSKEKLEKMSYEKLEKMYIKAVKKLGTAKKEETQYVKYRDRKKMLNNEMMKRIQKKKEDEDPNRAEKVYASLFGPTKQAWAEVPDTVNTGSLASSTSSSPALSLRSQKNNENNKILEEEIKFINSIIRNKQTKYIEMIRDNNYNKKGLKILDEDYKDKENRKNSGPNISIRYAIINAYNGKLESNDSQETPMKIFKETIDELKQNKDSLFTRIAAFKQQYTIGQQNLPPSKYFSLQNKNFQESRESSTDSPSASPKPTQRPRLETVFEREPTHASYQELFGISHASSSTNQTPPPSPPSKARAPPQLPPDDYEPEDNEDYELAPEEPIFGTREAILGKASSTPVIPEEDNENYELAQKEPIFGTREEILGKPPVKPVQPEEPIYGALGKPPVINNRQTKVPNRRPNNVSRNSKRPNNRRPNRNTRKNNSTENVEINHFWYQTWPDKDVPENLDEVREFITKVYNIIRETVGTTVIHCSAGVGRTGTIYIILKLIFDKLKGGELKPLIDYEISSLGIKESDIVKAFYSTRKARDITVQTQEQFAFIFDVLEPIGFRSKITKDIQTSPSNNTPLNSPSPHDSPYKYIYNIYNQIDNCKCEPIYYTDVSTGNEKLYYDDKSSYLTEKYTQCNNKNRYRDIIPYENNRVKLQPIEGEICSDYINASMMKPFIKGKHNVIATQCPNPKTIDDFKRMLKEQNVKNIIMVTGLVEKGKNKCSDYANGGLSELEQGEETKNKNIHTVFKLENNELTFVRRNKSF